MSILFVILAAAAAGAVLSGVAVARVSARIHRRRTLKIIEEQQTEFLRQQNDMRRIERQHKGYGEKLAESQSADEAAQVLAAINEDWNAGA